MSLHPSKRTGTLVIVGLLALAGCSESSSDGKDARDAGTITGTVTSSTGAAIAGVTVTPAPASGPAVTTDSAGKFTMPIAAGKYTLSFAADNYEPATASVSVDAGKTTTANQTLAASALQVTVNVPAALRNGGPAGFNTTVDGISATATLNGNAVNPDSITWSIKDYYGLSDPPAPATLTTASNGTVGFSIADFETLRQGANLWLNTRYGLTATADKSDLNGYIQAPPRDQLLSLGVQQVRAMSYKVMAKVKAGGRTTTGSAVIAPATITNGGNYQPLGMMVVANAAEAASYAWKLEYLSPAASTSTFGAPPSGVALQGAATKNPTLVPTVTGIYKLTNGSGTPLYFRVSTWHGAGTSPTDRGDDGVACADCHSGPYALDDKFEAWAGSAHGNTNFADPFATPTSLFKFGISGGEGSHYSESCISCHVVGYSKVPTAVNGGWDDVAKATGWTFPAPAPAAWDTVAANPGLLHRAGIQCESCHGPLEPTEHSQPEGNPALFALPVSPVASMNAGVCLYCHDALGNHDKGALWATSGHANTELAIEEGAGSTSCARCHSAEGFMLYLPLQQAGSPGNLPDISSLDAATVHSQTCQTCHDPHSTELRVDGDTKQVAGMFQLSNAGAGALCVVCHNSRSGAIKQGTYAIGSSSLGRLGPHTAAQGDMFAGRNAFFMPSLTATDAPTNLPYLSAHAFMGDTCVDCHVKWVPADLQAQYKPAGTNHTFRSSTEICAECHAADMGERIQEGISAKMATLQGRVSDVLSAKLLKAGFQTAVGARKDPSNTGTTLTDPADRTVLAANVRSIVARSNASAVTVTLNDGSQFYIGIGNVCAVSASPCDSTTSPATVTALLSTSETNTQTMLKAYFNLLFVNNDGAKGVHNPRFAAAVLDNATAALNGVVIP